MAAAAATTAAAAAAAAAPDGHGHDPSMAAAAAAAGAGGLPARRRLARHYLALAASLLDTQLGRSLYLLENALSIIVIHFLRYLPRPFSTPSANGTATANGNGSSSGGNGMLLDEATAGLDILNIPIPKESDASKLGSKADLAYFLSRLQETCLKSEELLLRGDAMRHHALDGIELMVRTIKSYCSSY